MRKCLCFILFVLLIILGVTAQNDTVVFSVRGGFYQDTLSLELSNIISQHHIRYTINGNRPTAQSPMYTGPLALDTGLYSKSDIYSILNCPETEFFLPDSVPHCIVIRAAAFDENDSCVSQVMTNSYFIRALGCDTHGLPVVSICADSLDLFDYERGIFVPGIYFDSLDPKWTGNYYELGMAWERPMNVEFYELDNTGINQQAGLRTHGGNGRRFQQKCVKIYAREEYGKKRFKHKFFETIPQNNFKHLVLKPFAASWNQSGVNDHICNQIASQLDLETLASRPVLFYLNGEYWGIYYLHEKPDERYLEDHFGADIDNVNIIGSWNPLLDHGTPDNFIALFNWVEENDLSNDMAMTYFENHVDVDNFIDYYIFELFAENFDWPANNMRCWQLGNGKWRWIFYDGDACLLWLTYFAFDNVIYDGDEYYPSNWKATLFFRRLLENEEFNERFHNRFYELLNTAFSYSVTGPIFDQIKATVEPEIPNQSARFGYPMSVDSWNEGMENVNWFLQKRSDGILERLDELLTGLQETRQDALFCYPNPFSDEIHLVIEAERIGMEEICVYDLIGRKVFAKPCLLTAGKNEIPVHLNVLPGVYILKIGNQTHRILRY